jgi:hypothetical protein
MEVIGISEEDHAKTVRRLIEIDDAVVFARRPPLPLSSVELPSQASWQATPQYVFGVNIRKFKQYLP